MQDIGTFLRKLHASVAIGCLYILRMVLVPGVMYCTWNGSESIVVWGCLLYVGRVLISDEGNLATARGWRWRLPRDEWCI